MPENDAEAGERIAHSGKYAPPTGDDIPLLRDVYERYAAGQPEADPAADSEQPPPERQATVEWASSIRPQRQVWLWENRIPAGTVSALAGRGGTGKTTYAVHLAAHITRGKLPGRHHGHPQPVLIWSGEDAWGPVLVPRLIAAGADLTKIGKLSITSAVVDGEVTPQLPVDVGRLRRAITDSGAALVIIDPIASTMTGDLHREADVRDALDPLARLAADTGAVVMFVRHFGKGPGHPSDKMSGSHAFRDAVRSVFLFAEDDHPDGHRIVVTQDKGNYAPPGNESFAFRLDNVTVPTDDGPVPVARVVDLGASDESVGDIINRATNRDDDTDARTEAERWLEDYLTMQGEVRSDEVKRNAAKAMIAERTLKRAMRNLGVSVSCRDMPRRTYWRLPNGATVPESAPNSHELGPTGPTESDQHKPVGPTGHELQSGQPPESGPTGPPGGITAATPGMTDRVARILATVKPAPGHFADPPCRYCRKPVVGKQTEPGTGHPAHFGCITTHLQETPA